MNLAVSCGTASGFAADCFGDISACANAPETISALTAAEIISVLSIMGLLSSLFRQGKEAFLVRKQLARRARVPCVWNLFGTWCRRRAKALSRTCNWMVCRKCSPPCTPPERNEKPGLLKDGRTNALD